LLYANTAYANILGRTQDELTSLTYWEVTPENYAEAEQLQLHSLQTTGCYGPYEKEYIHKDGYLVPVQLSGVIVERHGEQFIWSSVEDISDRKQAEAAIVQKSQELQQALQDLRQTQLQMIQSEKMSALGNLVAGIAHEINNPVGFISGNLHEAQQTVQDLVEHLNLYRDRAPETEIADRAEEIDLDYIIADLPKMIDSMKLGCDRIKDISTSLRTFSRADTDRPTLFNIHDGIDSTLLILKHRLKASDRRPAIEAIKNYGNLPEVNCFSGQLNQVFMNILANAIDAIEEGIEKGEISHPCIQIHTEAIGESVVIRIKDNAMGMPEDVKSRIFDHLFTTKGVGKGTGLGLAIARQIIVEKHQGAIDVNSALGQGTEFAIALPVCSFN
jgi:PAS domain S-box-containing protein